MHARTRNLRSLGAILIALMLSSPVAAREPAVDTAASNTALVRAAFEAWRAGTGSVFDLLHDDVEWTVAGFSPVSGIYRSKAAFMDDAVAPIIARLSTPISPTVRHIVAQGDTVVVVWNGVATATDGSAYRNHYAWHMVLEDGKIVRVIAFLDTWALEQLMR
ncbi:nuclear transport factor 2 family protein [Luteimonas aestuarii]|uniref:Nuclear transport factor 2 family protein n=1 Tax=Luteimonas aestuarii TaxID=453837 RepID=A0A4V3ALP4_9GAMM|nr:nuclear transport factor 2 family protein [Luteimonas aestuarii]TDK23814.1 nuclear transport factor 2 family protein [Luteimonas aestuarii]